MSQYPQSNLPGSVPPAGEEHPPDADFLAAAGRAALLMTILAVLAGLFGVLFISFARYLPVEQFLNAPGMQEAMQQAPELTAEKVIRLLRVMFILVGALGLATGGTLYGLGLFVRRGNNGAVLASIIVTALVLMLMGLYFLAVVAQSAHGAANAIVGMMLLAGPLYLASRQMKWLIAAAKISRQSRERHRLEMFARSGWPPPQSQNQSSGTTGVGFSLPPDARSQGPFAPPPYFPPGMGNLPGHHPAAYIEPPQAPPGYNQPGSGPVGYGYAQVPQQAPSATQPQPARPPDVTDSNPAAPKSNAEGENTGGDFTQR